MAEQHHQRYVEEHGRVSPTLPGAASWIRDLRVQGLEAFAGRGFPTTRDEEWKHTSTQALAKKSFTLARAECGGDELPADVARQVDGFEAYHVIFVNGRYHGSRRGALEGGLKVGALAGFLQDDPGRLEGVLGTTATLDDHPFTALNAAFMETGGVVMVPDGMVLDRPIHLLFVGDLDGGRTHPRNLVVLGTGAQATVVETYLSRGGGAHFTNGVTEVRLGKNSQLEYVKVLSENDASYHVHDLRVHQTRDSRFLSHAFTMGGGWVRNDVQSALDAEGVECTLNGLYLGTGSQHMDNHTTVDHRQPHGTSMELYKGVLGDRARGVFNGRVVVRENAQKTNAQQQNRNLLLSEEAAVNTKPQLEILANDVKCAHGSTIGQLDADMVFYLRSRGIDEARARNVLVYAFASELVDRVGVAAVRQRLSGMLAERLPGGILEGTM